MRSDDQYDVFISYSRRDVVFARSLEKALEAYRPPRELGLRQGHLRVFRDEQDRVGSEYFGAIERQLRQCAKLIVICSPAARGSAYVTDKIRRFAASHRPVDIIPIIVAGTPDNETAADQEVERAFPPALSEILSPMLAFHRCTPNRGARSRFQCRRNAHRERGRRSRGKTVERHRRPCDIPSAERTDCDRQLG